MSATNPQPAPSTADQPAVRATSGLLATLFYRWAQVRDDKPIHPVGSLHEATIRRYGGTRRWGVAWLDEPGEDVGVGRLSRALGLPRAFPDVLGLAVGFVSASGDQHDLLLSTTGVGRGLRHLMLPRRDPARAAYSSLFPYRGGGRSILLLAHPQRQRDAAEMRFVLAAATASSSWDPFGLLTLRPWAGPVDRPVTFDPVAHPLPGLRVAEPVATLRAATYGAARMGRGADPAELTSGR